MRTILIGLAVAFIALPVSAQTRDQNVARCVATDRDARIAGCTALIQSGQEAPDYLAPAYGNRGEAYMDKGLYDQAVADLTQAIKLYPRYEAFYLDRGNAYVDKGLNDQAIADYTQAVALKPDDAQAYHNRGAAYEHKGLRNQAIADYRSALKINPSYAIALNGLKRLGATGRVMAGTPLDHTVWQNQSCHFQRISFLAADAPVTPVSLYFRGDDFGWDESFSVSGSTVRIYKSSFDHEKDRGNDSFTGTFDATGLSGTHTWTDEGGSHSENCSYTRAAR